MSLVLPDNFQLIHFKSILLTDTLELLRCCIGDKRCQGKSELPVSPLNNHRLPKHIVSLNWRTIRPKIIFYVVSVFQLLFLWRLASTSSTKCTMFCQDQGHCFGKLHKGGKTDLAYCIVLKSHLGC